MMLMIMMMSRFPQTLSGRGRLKSFVNTLYSRSVFAFEHFEKRRALELKHFDFEAAKKLLVQSSSSSISSSSSSSSSSKKQAMGAYNYATIKKNLDTLTLTSKSENDLKFVVHMFKK